MGLWIVWLLTNPTFFPARLSDVQTSGKRRDGFMKETEDPAAVSRSAERALMAMQTRSIAPTPENFAIWYLHQCGGSPELDAAIEAIDRRRKGFSAEQMAELCSQFGDCDDQCRQVQLVSQRVGGLVDEVSSKLDAATSHTRDYSARLSSLGQGLSSIMEPSDLVAMVRELEHQTELMRNRAEKLETELERNSREIVHLKDDLATARRLATTDPLTGLGNRKLFNDIFAQEVERSIAEGTPLSLLVADIDHFKQFNDRHGHQIGDAVLKLVADKLKRSVKGRDTVARYGGEEFVVMLPDTEQASAASLADQLRTEIAKSRLVVRNKGQDLGKVTISIGVAEFRSEETPDCCFRRADEALYQAKNTGRNRVVTADEALAPEAVFA